MKRKGTRYQTKPEFFQITLNKIIFTDDILVQFVSKIKQVTVLGTYALRINAIQGCTKDHKQNDADGENKIDKKQNVSDQNTNIKKLAWEKGIKYVDMNNPD